jgi:carbon-monoxide dehydrogenase medium subunit
MKPAPFTYVRAETAADAIALIDDDPEAKFLAGGQSLLALMNLRLVRPGKLIDIGGLGELNRVFDDVDSVVVGATVRHRAFELDPLLKQRLPLVAAAARHIGHVAIRNQGTLGGSLAHADPAAELPAVMVTLGATIYAESRRRGRREIPAEAFFVSLYTSALEPDELLTWVRIPTLRPGEGWAFVEHARRHGDFAIAGAACVVGLRRDGTIEQVRAGLLNAGDRPLLVSDETSLAGHRPNAELWREVAAEWARRVDPPRDSGYVREVARASLTRALTTAYGRAVSHAPEVERWNT